MTDFATIIASRPHELNVRFYCKVGGVGHVFLSGPAPTGPDGSAWAAPTSKSHSYELQPHMLDVGKGLKDIGARLDPKKGLTDPGGLTIRLADRREEVLLADLIVEDSEEGGIGLLNADVDYATAGFGGVITTEDLAGTWEATGFAWLGRECLYYPAKTSTDLGITPANKITRDIFSLGESDATYLHQTANPGSAPRYVTTWPRHWYGRYVQIIAYLCDDDGVGYDSAFDGVYSREIFRGVIDGQPAWTDDWHTVELRLRDITRTLHAEVGTEVRKASLLNNVVQDANPEGPQSQWVGYNVGQVAYFLSDDTRFIVISVAEYATMTSVAPTTVGTWDNTSASPLEVFSGATLATGAAIRDQFNSALYGVVSGSGGAFPDLDLQLDYLGNTWSMTGKTTDSNKRFEVTYHWTGAGCIGPVLSFTADMTRSIHYASAGAVANASNTIGAFIPAAATQIPYFLPPNEGILADDPPSSGYARIGSGDDAEIVSYTGTTSYGGTGKLLWTLDGCQRGLMGTDAVDRYVPIAPTSAGAQDAQEIAFGVGWENSSVFDVIREFAVSTGESAHHGSHDVLAAGWGLGMDSNHIDHDRFDSLKQSITKEHHHVRRFFMSKSAKLSKLINDWMAPLGCYVTARPNADGDYLITVDRQLPPMESSSVQSLGISHIDGTDPAKWRDTTGQIVNRVVIEYRYDAAEESMDDKAKVTIDEPNSRAIYGTRGKVEWKLRGYNWDFGSAIDNGVAMAARMWEWLGRPTREMDIKLSDRVGWLINPGDAISVTLPGVPTTGGVRGYVNRLMVVTKTKPAYWTPKGQVGAVVTVRESLYIRRSSYSPSAKVASRSGNDLTLAANEYTTEGSDASHFDVLDKVTLFERGNYSATATAGVITVIAGNVVTTTGFSSYTVSADTRMVPRTYTSVVARQRAHAFIADNTATPVLGTSDTTAFKLV